MAKAFIIKSLTDVVNVSDNDVGPARTEDLSRPEDTIHESDLRSQQLDDDQKELNNFTNETDPCIRVKTFLDAYQHNNQLVKEEVNYAEISDYLISSGLIDQSGGVGILGNRLLKMKRGDTEYQNLCFEIISSVYENNTIAKNELDEIRHTAASEVPVVSVSTGNRIVLLLELIGLQSKREKQQLLSTEYFTVQFTKISKTVFLRLNNKIQQNPNDRQLTVYQITKNFKIFEVNIAQNEVNLTFKNRSPLVKVGSVVSLGIVYYLSFNIALKILVKVVTIIAAIIKF